MKEVKNYRIGPQGIIQKEIKNYMGLKTWVDTDLRIDQNTGEIQIKRKKKFFKYEWIDTGLRVNQETGKIQIFKTKSFYEGGSGKIS